MELKNKRLAVHFHIPILIKEDGYYYPEYYGTWIDSLAPYFKEIICISYSVKVSNENKYRLLSNISLVNLGDKPVLRNTIIKNNKYKSILKDKLDLFDIIIYRAPTPLAVYFYPITKNKINIFFMVANILEGIKGSKNDMNLVKYHLWKQYWNWDHSLLQKYANNSLTLTNGPIFSEEFKRIKKQKVVFSSTIYNNDLLKKKSKLKLDNKVKLLFLGRISKEKSIDTLIEAVDILSKKNVNVELNIVGAGDKVLENKLKQLSNRLGLKNVNFLGHISLKQDIFDVMDHSDIFIIPSYQDVQPRTLWEAMARGLPIICSKGVKSPYLLFKHEKDMLFSDIKDSQNMANNIQELIKNENLRRYLINRSLQIAKERTIEASIKLQIENITEYINNVKKA